MSKHHILAWNTTSEKVDLNYCRSELIWNVIFYTMTDHPMCIRFVLACMCSAVASVSGRSAPLFKLSNNVGKGLLFLLCTAVRLDILMCRARFGNIYIDVHTWKCTYGCLKIHLTKIWEHWYKLGYFLRIYLKLMGKVSPKKKLLWVQEWLKDSKRSPKSPEAGRNLIHHHATYRIPRIPYQCTGLRAPR